MKKLSIMMPALLAGALAVSANSWAAEGKPNHHSSELSPTQTKQIEQVVHDYLVKNPQVLVEASQALQQQQMSQMQQVANKAISKNAKEIFNAPTSPVIGNPNGDVTIVEFMDYQCGHCKAMNSVVDSLIKSDPNLRVVYKEFPIFGPTSELAAKAALAAQKQGKFQALHDALMSDDNPLSQAEVMKLAQSAGIDTTKLTAAMNDAGVEKELKNNLFLAQEMHLEGTPAIIVGNRNGTKVVFIPGTTSKDNLQQIIAQIRK